MVLQSREMLQVPVSRHSALENGARTLSTEQGASSRHHRHRIASAKIFILQWELYFNFLFKIICVFLSFATALFRNFLPI